MPALLNNELSVYRTGKEQDKIIFPQAKFLTFILNETQKNIMGIHKDVLNTSDWHMVLSCDSHFFPGFFEIDKFKPPSMGAVRLTLCRPDKNVVPPDPNISSLRPAGTVVFVHPKNMTVSKQ